MVENLDFLPAWVTRAGVPAVAVMGFFWKGDEALSEDFKKWLSQKILGMKLTVPNISSLEPLAKVFDFIYGRRYFALTTALRVTAISVVALIVTSLVVAGGIANAIAAFQRTVREDLPFVVNFLLANILFDYVSVTKSRVLIMSITKLTSKGREALFFVSDLLITCFIVWLYAMTFYRILAQTSLPPKYIYIPMELQTAPPSILFPMISFSMTTFMTLLLTILYSFALMSLRILAVIKKAAGIVQWMLPVQTVPIRSIGMVGGALLFCLLEIFHAFAG